MLPTAIKPENHIFMKTQTFFLSGFLLLQLFLSPFITRAQQQKQPPRNIDLKCTFRYPDGTPVKFFSISDLDPFDVHDVNQKYNKGWISSVRHDTVTIHCNWAGEYLLSFEGKKIAAFKVTEKEGQLVSDLPAILTLPFSFVVKAPPHSTLKTYSTGSSVTRQLKTGDNGYFFFSQKPDPQKEVFVACFFPGHFPKIETFYNGDTNKLVYLRNRIISFSAPTAPPHLVKDSYKPTQYNKTVVHNLDEDAYYTLLKTSLYNSDETYLWLAVYRKKTQQASLTFVPVTGNRKTLAFALFLEETGRPVVVLAQQNPKTYNYSSKFFKVGPNGSLQPFQANVYPRYAFKGNYIDGIYWIIPTFYNIPLKPGRHTIDITCFAKDSGTGSAKKETKHQSFEVSFAPQRKYFWKITDITHPDDSVSMQFDTPAFDFNIKKCTVSVDGGSPLSYSYMDDMALKAVGMADYDSEEERAKAVKQALARAPVYVGLGPDARLWDNRVRLLDPTAVVSGKPLNIWEGPYPTLRYNIKKITGKYDTREEALKQCKNPKMHHHKYFCYEEKTVNVCPDQIRYSVENGKVKIDSASLFCGQNTAKAYMPHGKNILVVVNARGYRAYTTELDKKDLQVSDIHLSGTITGKDGRPLSGVKISLVGQNASFVTDSTGQYTLNGKAHGKEPLTETLNIKLQPLGIQVIIDTFGIYEPGKIYGLVADGFTTLKIHVKTEGLNPGSVKVEMPATGGFVPQNKAGTPLVLNGNGEGDMEYVPPAYLKNNFLTKHIPIKQELKGPHGLSGDLWAADVPVTLTYEDKDGNPGSYTFDIMVCRPPVMLVHGFTGDEHTWEQLAVQLRHDKYDAIIREYYHGTPEQSAIETQAQKLDFYIRELRKAYYKSGILQNRVDIVAHSMGGLISRYYISNMPKYGQKAGLAIPYNIRLSREQLKQMRFKKSVILNTVRKLIMVGTPNHGASYLDERIGALNALISDVHQVANEQLRFDSPFLAQLNAGESEGRHLATNVQYALIYGLRRRSQIYPLDNVLYPVKTAMRDLAPDDGVVTKKSAMLNGVISYGFPPDLLVYKYGYIHSPILANLCAGDASITNDPPVFDKIEELLQEDIPRVPLKNSVSKIIDAKGQVSMRYYSTQKWIKLRTPIHYPYTKKLRYNFCRIKTGEGGTATLGFFLNGHHWGSLSIEPNTTIYYESASPEYVRVYLQQGRARFRSRKQNGGGFDVVMGDRNGKQWYTFNPKARVKDLNTDFIVEEDTALDVHSLSGKVVLSLSLEKDKKPELKTISAKGGYIVSNNGNLIQSPLPDSGWWSNIDTTFLPDEIPDSIRNPLSDSVVHITFQNKYLPVSGFTSLKVHIDTLPGDSILHFYTVDVKLLNDTTLPFVNVTNPQGQTDDNGNYKTDITLRELEPDSYHSLNKLPLKARLSIILRQKESNAIIYEKDTVLPLGMSLLYGKMVGPGYKPQKNPQPPEFYDAIYQIANEADKNGNFYILFNTTLYNSNKKRLEAFANRTKGNPTENLLAFRLQWADPYAFPLNYPIPDSIKRKMKPGTRIKLGNNGYFDLLMSSEQQKRIVHLTRLFVDAMPLTDSVKGLLLSELDSLDWVYNAPVKVPAFVLKNKDKPVIYLPHSPQEFWNKACYDSTGNSYTGIFQAVSCFISQEVCLDYLRNYDFLQPQFPENDTQTNPFYDKQSYKAFAKAGELFFNRLLVQYLRNTANPFLTQSIYSPPLLLSKNNKGNSQDLNPDDDPLRQFHFLLQYYGKDVKSNPVKIYSDFLLAKKLYSVFTGNKTPALSLKEWLVAKKAYFNKTALVHTGDPFPLAKQQKLLSEYLKIRLIPVSDFKNCTVTVNGKIYTGFDKIPSFSIGKPADIEITGGKFRLQIPELGGNALMEMGAGAHLTVVPRALPLLVNGKFIFKAPIAFRLQKAAVFPKSNNFIVTTDSKHTVINVLEGSVTVQGAKGKIDANQGQSVTVNSSGNVRKPKEIKYFSAPAPPPMPKLPFVVSEK